MMHLTELHLEDQGGESPLLNSTVADIARHNVNVCPRHPWATLDLSPCWDLNGSLPSTWCNIVPGGLLKGFTRLTELTVNNVQSKLIFEIRFLPQLARLQRLLLNIRWVHYYITVIYGWAVQVLVECKATLCFNEA